jgi:cytoskeletal protein CcmA (bactofilin family)
MGKRLILSTLLLIMLVFLSFPSDTEAADFRSGSEVNIGPEETVNDDLYAARGTINFNGIIDGDLVAAGGTINVRGTINGDVIASGGSVMVNGMVRDNVRASGGTVIINSTVAGDVVVAGGSVELEPGASVGRDMVIGAGSVQIDGNVERDLLLGAGSATINGTVGGDVKAELSDGLTLGPMARIEGDLAVTSPQEIGVAQGATVLGNTVYEELTTSLFWVSVRETAGIQVVQDIASRVQWFLGTALVGLLLWIVPRTLEGTSETVIRSPWGSLGLGVAVLILAPIVIVIAAVIAIFIGGFAGVPVAVVPHRSIPGASGADCTGDWIPHRQIPARQAERLQSICRMAGAVVGGVDPGIDRVRAVLELGRYSADSTFRLWGLGALSVQALPGSAAGGERLRGCLKGFITLPYR